jgi:putative ABC transport system permease protein
LFFFLGTFLSVVFLLATGSIHYFKVLSEGLADREKYSVLVRLGLTGQELRKAVSMQLGLSLLVPLLVGLLHSVFAVAELSNLLDYSLLTPYLWAVGVYLVCYAGINALTTRKFLSLVQAAPSVS